MYLICDIDGTLSREPADRQAAAIIRDWDRYYSLDFSADEPIHGVCTLVDSFLAAGGIVYFVTNRRGTVRDETLAWIRRNIPSSNAANSHLVMRDFDCNIPSAEWKVHAVITICSKASACTVIDDDRRACSVLRGLGYTVLEVV